MFKGSLVALATPFDSNNRVDYASLKGLIDFHVNEGTDGLVIAGTTGEAATMNRDEHTELVARSVEFAAGRLPVIAGTGSNSTRQTINMSLAVAEAGVDGFHGAQGALGARARAGGPRRGRPSPAAEGLRALSPDGGAPDRRRRDGRSGCGAGWQAGRA